MTKTNLLKFFKGNAFYITGLLLLLALMIPSVKSRLFQGLISVGLFKAEIQKKPVHSDKTFPFQYADASGKNFSSESLKGKVVFINFWATWCPPCRAEMPSIYSLFEQLKSDERFVFLLINEDEDATKAIEYLAKNKYLFPIYRSLGNVPKEIFSGSLPTTIVLDKNGHIAMRKEGMAGYDSEEFIEQLKSLL